MAVQERGIGPRLPDGTRSFEGQAPFQKLGLGILTLGVGAPVFALVGPGSASRVDSAWIVVLVGAAVALVGVWLRGYRDCWVLARRQAIRYRRNPLGMKSTLSIDVVEVARVESMDETQNVWAEIRLRTENGMIEMLDQGDAALATAIAEALDVPVELRSVSGELR